MRHELTDLPLQRMSLNDAAEIHYVEAGSGQPVVFVHGGMGDWSSWAPQWQAFTAGFRCISYSRRYSSPNRNPLSSPSHSVRIEAQDLSQLLGQWCQEPAILVGTSYGAYTALQLALESPGQMRALVITEPPILPFADEVDGGRDARQRFERDVLQPATDAFRRGDDAGAVTLLTDGINGQGPGEAHTRLGRDRRQRNAAAMRALCLSTDAYPALDRMALKKLAVPTLLTSGERTEAVHRATTAGLRQYLTQARFVTVPDSGHGVHRDNPEAFNALVLDFIRTLCQGPLPA